MVFGCFARFIQEGTNYVAERLADEEDGGVAFAFCVACCVGGGPGVDQWD